MPKSRRPAAAPLNLFTELLLICFLVGALIILAVNKPSPGLVSGAHTNSQAAPILPLPSPTPALIALNPPSEPPLTAKAAYVYDPVSRTVLFAKNPHLRLPPASTTKLMTAWVALHEYSPQATVFIKDADQSIGQTANLLSGEEVTVENLIKAMLINSGNDAALALAQHHPQGYAFFVSLMNQAATNMGLLNTHFTNVSGVEEPDHYSSAYDLSLLGQNVTQNEFINRVVQIKNETVSNLDGNLLHPLENTNKLLWANNGVNGIKTGWTQNAGECLITRVVRPEFSLIITVLGSTDRFGETQTLIDWAYANFKPSN